MNVANRALAVDKIQAPIKGVRIQGGTVEVKCLADKSDRVVDGDDIDVGVAARLDSHARQERSLVTAVKNGVCPVDVHSSVGRTVVGARHQGQLLHSDNAQVEGDGSSSASNHTRTKEEAIAVNLDSCLAVKGNVVNAYNRAEFGAKSTERNTNRRWCSCANAGRVTSSSESNRSSVFGAVASNVAVALEPEKEEVKLQLVMQSHRHCQAPKQLTGPSRRCNLE